MWRTRRGAVAWFVVGGFLVAMLASCGDTDGGNGADGDLPASTFRVDESIQPAYGALTGFSEGEVRPVAAVVDERGVQAEFVQNELLVVTDDREELDAFLERWSGEVIHELDTSGTELEQRPKHVLVRVESETAPVDRLPELTRGIHPERRNDLRVSSRAGLELLAVGAVERSRGFEVGVSWIGRTEAAIDRRTDEAPTGQDWGGVAYSTNAFDWPTHSTGSAQNIGTAEAWRYLTVAGRLDNRVKVAILDQGFSRSDVAGLPEGTAFYANAPYSDPYRRPLDTSGHGAKVAHAAMAALDDGYGSAGSAGPIGVGVAVYTSYDIVMSISALAIARRHGAKIANMSYGTKVPAVLSFTAEPFELATRLLSASGMLLFAAAGNDGVDNDGESCGPFGLICWEHTWDSPCENDGVICVGGLGWNSDTRDPSSNYGGEDVDIWGPYSMWLGPDPSEPNNDATMKFGTSYASPYVAGVAALIWAAHPRLSGDRVAEILYNTAHASRDGDVNRIVNALGAVTHALGGNTPPYIEITSPPNGSTYARGSISIPLDARVEDLDSDVQSVTWDSDRDGRVAEGAHTSVTNLSVGTHRLTVTALDEAEHRVTDSVTVTLVNNPPRVEIVSPTRGQTFFESQSISLQATSYDPNDATSLPDNNVQWYLDDDERPVANGHSTTLAGGSLSVGLHTIRLIGSDGVARGEDAVDIEIEADPAGNIGPTAVVDSPDAGEQFLADTYDSSLDRHFAVVTLCGHGEDPEDGVLEGDAVNWYYREVGESVWQVAGSDPGSGLCRNRRFYLRSPDGTRYELQVRVTDSEGESGTSTISILVYGLI